MKEAAEVFYSQNTFAFEDATSFIAFAQNLNSRWRHKVSKVSIMANSWVHRPDEVDSAHQGVMLPEQLKPSMWALLRSLPHLSHLELELSYLLHSESARAASRLGHQNLIHVRFVQRVPEDSEWAKGTQSIWPQFAGRVLQVGGLVEEIARAMKGQRQKHLKHAQAFKENVREFRWAMEKKAIGL